MPTRLRLTIASCLLVLAPRFVSAEEPARELVVASIDAQTLMFRRARSNGIGYEGFFIDSNSLVDTLKSRVLEARALGSVASISRAALDQQTAPAAIAAPKSRVYEFNHRFAEPFSSIAARMKLAPLEDPSEGALVDELVLTLALCVVLGLYALYRMTATQLVFAERSRNFVSAVSHELKTPLTAIRMYGEILSDDLVSDEDKRREYYRTITQESERLTRLIDNVLDLSRLEQRRELQLQQDDVRPHVRDAIEVLRPHAERQGFRIEIDCDPDLPEVEFEPDALKQVTFNLVDNCMKYGRDAQDKRIKVELRRTANGARLTVRDFGEGVQPSHMRKIFLPFFRGQRELTRKYAGTGIGLALVKSLVLGMHGRVTAENSNPGLIVSVDLTARG
jgi:two-component system, OmpR family, phosphate regulon sensor histidine kinase PhoR